MFCAMLGTVAGNLALTLGARGGIYIAGGIVPKLGDAFAQSPFRARFEDKGRFSTYLAAIPTYVVVSPRRCAARGRKAARCGVEQTAGYSRFEANSAYVDDHHADRHINRASG